MELGRSKAQWEVHSRGSTAISTCGKDESRRPFPSSSPIYNMGALSISPSPIATRAWTGIESKALRIAFTAASSALFLSPHPLNFPQAMAACSVACRK